MFFRIWVIIWVGLLLGCGEPTQNQAAEKQVQPEKVYRWRLVTAWPDFAGF